jgi:hypothetical protein
MDCESYDAVSVCHATRWQCISSQNILLHISGNNMTEYKSYITSATDICTVEICEKEVINWCTEMGLEYWSRMAF